MSIKSQGGVFGRNPTFRNVEVEGNLTVDGTLTIGGSVITGLNYQGGWDASTNTPDLTVLSPPSGQFWIVSADGNTNLGGITNWTSGDWALYDGSAWQRVEGGNTDLDTGVSGTLKILNGGTGANDAATARTNLGSGAVGDNVFTAATVSAAQQAMDVEVGVDVQAYDATILKSADIGSTVQAYDATILKSADIGSTVQAYDADTAKLDVAQTWTAKQTFGATDIDGAVVINESGADVDFRIESDTITNAFFVDGANGNVGIGSGAPFSKVTISDDTPLISTYWNTLRADISDYIAGGIDANFRTRDANNNIGAYIRLLDVNTYSAFPTQIRGGEITFGTVNGLSNPYDDAFERMRIDTNGNVKINSGNLVIGTSGKGIDFSATAGTGTSELLDDYEEGTWTPTPNNYSGTPVVEGYYTKIGNMCFASFYIALDGTSDGSTFSVFLPFASFNGTNAMFGSAISYTTSTVTGLSFRVRDANTEFRAHNNSGTELTYNTFGVSAVVSGTIIFRTST